MTPVAAYWPAFAKHGKGTVTIRHILTHRGGFPETPPELSWDRWQDWDYVVECMEDIIPDYPAGQIMAYHPRNFGWVIGELVRRIDGRHIGAFLREEILDPLALHDGYVGLPPELEPRVSRIHAMEDCDRPGMIRPYNRPEVHQAVHPAGGGIFTARDLARFYAMLRQRRRAGRRADYGTGHGGRSYPPPFRGQRLFPGYADAPGPGLCSGRQPYGRPPRTRTGPRHFRTRRRRHLRGLG